MAGQVFDIHFYDDDRTIMEFTGMRNRIHDPHDCLETTGIFMQRETEKNIEGQHDPFGGAWEPLKDSTIERKVRKWFIGLCANPYRILEETRALYDSINYEVLGKTVAIGTWIPDYPDAHQWGNGHVPQRQFLGIGDDAAQGILDIVGAYVRP